MTKPDSYKKMCFLHQILPWKLGALLTHKYLYGQKIFEMRGLEKSWKTGTHTLPLKVSKIHSPKKHSKNKQTFDFLCIDISHCTSTPHDNDFHFYLSLLQNVSWNAGSTWTAGRIHYKIFIILLFEGKRTHDTSLLSVILRWKIQ